MTTAAGILAIWNRCVPAMEVDYETWYQTEHLFERLSIPGFQRGRRYEAIRPRDGFFTYYETDRPDVLTSAPYLERVNNPTPMTAHIMSNAFTDMSRTVCERLLTIGRMSGAFAATFQMTDLPPTSWLSDWASSEERVSSIARIEVWRAIDDGLPQSTEARLRGGDDRIEACLFIETLRERDCLDVSEQLAGKLGVPETKIGTYRLLCELTSSRRGETSDQKDHA